MKLLGRHQSSVDRAQGRSARHIESQHPGKIDQGSGQARDGDPISLHDVVIGQVIRPMHDDRTGRSCERERTERNDLDLARLDALQTMQNRGASVGANSTQARRRRSLLEGIGDTIDHKPISSHSSPSTATHGALDTTGGHPERAGIAAIDHAVALGCKDATQPLGIHPAISIEDWPPSGEPHHHSGTLSCPRARGEPLNNSKLSGGVGVRRLGSASRRGLLCGASGVVLVR